MSAREPGAADWGRQVLIGAALAGLVAGALVVGLVAVLQSGGAAVGALVGSVGTVAVLGAGTWVTLKVARAAPTVSLLAALGVFTLQGVLLLVMLLVLRGAMSATATTAGAVAVIVVTVVWTTSFALLLRRARIPLFDLSAMAPPSASEDASEPPRPGTR